ncbi:MAG: tRNA (adenosine(37)-N6)-threonylcarbamoyltransferase complex transferase subunit TsaD, partial [Selenomonadaceae bacterium]|nr:tRNA (adenosine(37)-N6)-threonylcarbamoyltransferase complex transferase subunit TsaD [Selenomonadaceae bacterium]
MSKGDRQDCLTLAIESSCDETSAAVLRGGREILSNIISTQIPVHQKFGGVVPEIASRKHIVNI